MGGGVELGLYFFYMGVFFRFWFDLRNPERDAVLVNYHQHHHHHDYYYFLGGERDQNLFFSKKGFETHPLQKTRKETPPFLGKTGLRFGRGFGVRWGGGIRRGVWSGREMNISFLRFIY